MIDKKFTQTDVTNLTNILSICNLVNIEAIVIDNKKLSGMNNDRSCAIIVSENIPELPEGIKLGISKLNVLRQRIDLFKQDPQLFIEVDEKANGEISVLKLKGAKASSQYRATSPSTIKYPTEISDIEIKKIFISKEQAQMILSASKTMGSKKIIVNVKKNNDVVIELSDKVNDLFTISLDQKAEDLGESSTSNVSYYFEDVFSPLLRAATTDVDVISLIICEASARIIVGGYEITILAPMGDD
jgi:hypothetical protein